MCAMCNSTSIVSMNYGTTNANLKKTFVSKTIDEKVIQNCYAIYTYVASEAKLKKA